MPLKAASEYDAVLRNALTEHGYIEITPKVERQIARRYCDNLEAVESLEDRIEILNRKKMAFVDAQDFAAAAKTRELEHSVRDELDNIVKIAANKTRRANRSPNMQ